MNLGLGKKEDRKKMIAAGVLLLVAGVLLYVNVFSGPDTSPQTTAASNTPAAPAATADNAPPPVLRRGSTGRGSSEFRPGVKRDKNIDVTKVDPTLHLELLAKLQGVSPEGGARNIFQFGQAAPPPEPKGEIPKTGKIDPKKVIADNTAPPAPGPPATPTTPQIPFKYYGFSSMKGEPRKRAFFLDGEDIIVAWEGDLIKNRYKVIHVGVNSVDVEDTQSKSKQSLPLAEEAPTA